MTTQPQSRLTSVCIATMVCLGLSLPACLAATPASSPDRPGPKLEFLQSLDSSAAGCARLKDIRSAAMVGDFLYVCTGKDKSDRKDKNPKFILCFKRDAATGKLAPAGETEVRKILVLAAAGTRLYGFCTDIGQLQWFDVDAASGKLTEKEPVWCPVICGGVCVSPDQKGLYYKGFRGPGLVGFHLADDGKPVKVAEVNGKGLERSGWGLSPCAITISPDGKFIYGVSGTPLNLAVVERKSTGEVVSKKEVAPPADVTFAKGYPWVSLAVTPDGKWLYASVLGYGKAADDLYAVYARDPQTGDVTFKEALSHMAMGDQGEAWKMLFLPDGSGGYWSHAHGLAAFTRDAATGRITRSKVLDEAKAIPPQALVWDSANGFLYGGSEQGDALFVLATEKVPAGK